MYLEIQTLDCRELLPNKGKSTAKQLISQEVIDLIDSELKDKKSKSDIKKYI